MATPSTSERVAKEGDEEEGDFAQMLEGEHALDAAEERAATYEAIFSPIRSALLMQVVSHLPQEQRGMFFFLLVTFHEDFNSALRVYSALPAFAMWAFTERCPHYTVALLYATLRLINIWMDRREDDLSKTLKKIVLYSVTSGILSAFIDLRDITQELELLFGSSALWPAAMLPIFPGMFLRPAHERPTSINGFVPEQKQGIIMAIFVWACNVVLPDYCAWGIWMLYTTPAPEYPGMRIDWLFCTLCWYNSGVTTTGAFAVWLMVNQYRFPRTWFHSYGGSPSVIMLRERSGTKWYIATMIVLAIGEQAFGAQIDESTMLTLKPRAWTALLIMLGTSAYLLKFGLLLRIYKYRHKQLPKGRYIRLLRLRAQPTLQNAPIQCDMIITPLRNVPQYVAISHRWKAVGEADEMILIDGGLFPISQTIFSLLLAKRSNMYPIYLWIDSICINQDDMIEKGRQVGLMRYIFEEAETTMGWLGDSENAKNAVDLLGLVSRCKTAEAYSALRSRPDPGWADLEIMMSNEWFGRAWMIQEIAASRYSIIRYGTCEIEWGILSDAIARMLLYSAQDAIESTRTPLPYEAMLHARVIEEVRYHVSNADLIKLKDAIKLAWYSEATLPVDKVYALIGLVDERHLPLFISAHSKPLSAANTRSTDAVAIVQQSTEVMELISDIIGTASGTKNSKRGRAILNKGVDSAMRHTLHLTSNLHQLTERLKSLSDSARQDGAENDGAAPRKSAPNPSIQFDYLDPYSAGKVYIQLARILVHEGDSLAFLTHAGGFESGTDLGVRLPSWVPDWTAPRNTYVLPWCLRKTTGPIDKEDKGKEALAIKPVTTFTIARDNGMDSLLLRATSMERIQHIAPLSVDFTCSLTTRDSSIMSDYDLHGERFKAAYELAKQHTHSRYGANDDEILTALYSTFHAGTQPSTPNLFDTHLSSSVFNDETTLDTYIHTRRTASSRPAKFAHMVRQDIIPSFSQYRNAKLQTRTDNPLSILNAATPGPLDGFERYVDYTINRSLAVVESGVLMLAPAACVVGDAVVKVDDGRRMAWFAIRRGDMFGCADPECELEMEKVVEGKVEEGQWRLVGEVYVHEPEGARDVEEEKERWFKLW